MPTPSKINTGTVAEVFSHREEIPANAMLELKVYDRGRSGGEIRDGKWGGKSLLELFGDLVGTVHGGPDDMASNPEKYMAGFGQPQNRRNLGS